MAFPHPLGPDTIGWNRHYAPVAEFVGVTSEPGWGIGDSRGASSGLYEFKTEAGVPVRLHDASFIGVDFRAGPTPLLVTRFLYEDPKWTPAEARSTPLIKIQFEDVQISKWEQEPHAIDEPTEAIGQVSSFDYYEDVDAFDLQTYTLRLEFTAKRVEVTLHPWPRA